MNGVARICHLLLDDDRCRTLFLLKESAAIACDEIACVVMNEEVILEANFHGTGGCRNVGGQSAGLLDDLVDGQAFRCSQFAWCWRQWFLEDFNRNHG